MKDYGFGVESFRELILVIVGKDRVGEKIINFVKYIIFWLVYKFEYYFFVSR